MRSVARLQKHTDGHGEDHGDDERDNHSTDHVNHGEA